MVWLLVVTLGVVTLVVVIFVVVGDGASIAAADRGALGPVTTPRVNECPETRSGMLIKIRRPMTTTPTRARTGPTRERPCNRDTMTRLPPSKPVRLASAGNTDLIGTRRSHWGQREPYIVWSHVHSASDRYWRPHSVLVGLGKLSATACHSGAQYLGRNRETLKPRRRISGTARYLMAPTPPTSFNPNFTWSRYRPTRGFQAALSSEMTNSQQGRSVLLQLVRGRDSR